ncbi:ABC transporter ATP-binding protein [Acinetobacter dispersus]|uniref:ABC transporter ATP-binding protein n=1 Tax=Acinetobacter dispersus TaxID=70348 RepID=UPI00132E8235|nr:ABC transporter ATP-binding protein [Acinetobacter dispersus]QHH96405.1 ABC transporter ATP-binding protein [Acinetobacter dispersus]
MKKLIPLFLILAQSTFAAETWVSGKITNITSITEGLLIKLEEGNLPTVCNGHAAFGWFLIPQERKTIIALTLIHWSQGNRQVDVYVDPNQSTNNYCTVQQIHPL